MMFVPGQLNLIITFLHIRFRFREIGSLLEIIPDQRTHT